MEEIHYIDRESEEDANDEDRESKRREIGLEGNMGGKRKLFLYQRHKVVNSKGGSRK